MLPVAVMDPVMGKDVSGANHIVQRMRDGATPVVPNLFIPAVDVRDVANAPVMAMTNPAAASERFLPSNGRALRLKEIGAFIRAALGDPAKRVPTRASRGDRRCGGFHDRANTLSPRSTPAAKASARCNCTGEGRRAFAVPAIAWRHF